MQEVQGGDAELAEGSVGREEERKRELRGSLGMGGANGRRRRLWTPRRARLGAWSREGSRGGGRRSVCKAKGGRRARRGRERAGELVHGTARLVRRRGTPTAVLGVRAGRECRVERPRSIGSSQGRGAVRARRVAGGLTRRRPRLGRKQGREERTERVERKREREIKVIQNLNFSQGFRLKHEKLRIRKL